MVGIPLIVLALLILLSRPQIAFHAHLAITPAMLVSLAAAAFYLRMDLRFGLAMAVLLAGGAWLGYDVASASTFLWLTVGLVEFAFGWVLQFVGHWFEGRKPAFVDDLSDLAIGPLFILAEVAFLLGCRLEVQQAMAQSNNRAAPVPTGKALRSRKL